MNELSKRSGFPASTIRFYLTEGLLPEPERPTRNSAIYDERHLARLSQIKQVREGAGSLPLASLKRVLELLDRGIEPGVAISLHQSVAGQVGDLAETVSGLDVQGLADRTGTSPGLISNLIDLGVMVPEPGDSPQFDGADIKLLQSVLELLKVVPDALDDLGEAASHIKRASALEMGLRNKASSQLDDQTAAALTEKFQHWGQFWHAYLFARFRLNEIAEFGLGNLKQGEEHDDDNK